MTTVPQGFPQSTGTALRARPARLLLLPGVVAAVLLVDVIAYAAGMTLWYGPVLSDPATPARAWPFVPDCPLFGLLGGLGLLLVAAPSWGAQAQARAQRGVLLAAALALAGWAGASLPGAGAAWRGLGATFALAGAALLACGLFLRQPAARRPDWLLCLVAAGQIKYGIWTIAAWALFWRNTAALFGSPILSTESLVMTVSHVALVAQGVVLLALVRPGLGAALATLLWFGLSDVVDYWPLIGGRAWHPAVPPILPLHVLQWTMITTTVLLALGLGAASLFPRARQVQPQPDRARGVPSSAGRV